MNCGKKKPGFCPGLKLLLILTKSPQTPYHAGESRTP